MSEPTPAEINLFKSAKLSLHLAQRGHHDEAAQIMEASADAYHRETQDVHELENGGVIVES